MVMKISCGALFYTYNPDGEIGVVLGQEGYEYFVFKGCQEHQESIEETAIREIKEETCGLVNVSCIMLNHRFSSKRKHYYIGLYYVPYSIIEQFELLRKDESRKECMEKINIRFFHLDEVLQIDNVHKITKYTIKFYWNILCIASLYPKKFIKMHNRLARLRKHSVSYSFAKNYMLKKYDTNKQLFETHHDYQKHSDDYHMHDSCITH